MPTKLIAGMVLGLMTVVTLAGCGNQQQNQGQEKRNQERMPEAPAGPMNQEQRPGSGEMAPEAMPAETGYQDISPMEAKKMIDENAELIVIDVSPNYAKGHLPGAVNYYLGDGSLDKAIPTLDKEREYLVYCHVETASRQGAQKLVDAGFEKVYRMEGDYPAWVQAGYPVEQ